MLQETKFTIIAKYKKYLNTLTKLIQAAKRMYYHNEVFVHKNNISKQWGIINIVLSNKRKYQEVITSLIGYENESLVHRSAICDALNDFFVNIGQTMDAKIPQTNKTFRIPSKSKSFVYEPITCNEVVLEISQ